MWIQFVCAGLLALGSSGPAPVVEDLWFKGSFDAALARAKSEKKLVLVDFRADPCPPCKRLDAESYSDAKVRSALADVVCLAVDADGPSGAALAARWRVRSEPARIWISPDGAVRERVDGFAAAAALCAEIERVKADRGTIGELLRRAQSEPKSVDVHWQLAEKLQSVGDSSGVERECAAILTLTPDATSIAARRAVLARAIESAETSFDARHGTFDLAALREFAKSEREPALVFSAWQQIVDFEALALANIQRAPEGTAPQAAGARNRLREAYRSAWAVCPADRRAAFGPKLALAFYAANGELSQADKTFTLEVATLAAAATRYEDPTTLDALACSLYLNGKTQDALRMVQQCIDRDPKDQRWKDRLEELSN